MCLTDQVIYQEAICSRLPKNLNTQHSSAVLGIQNLAAERENAMQNAQMLASHSVKYAYVLCIIIVYVVKY